ncbi:MAG: glycosyltransferase [Candidatus Moranbacteria bacterium]|nr:glycosyltransferase [Candidatus Moranbacteria bacterium]
MRIALVHDYLIQYGGAERVLESFMEIFPKAPVYTLIYDEKTLGKTFKNKLIRTSFLQKIPFAKSEHHFFPILMPTAIEQFDLSYYDVVLSDSSSYAKGVVTSPGTLHICYCHTPMRYAWDDCHKYTREYNYPWGVKKLVPIGMNYIRIWDRMAAQRVDHFIANSNLVQRRIKKYYKANSKVIYPPLFLENFKLQPQDLTFKENKKRQKDYYLMVGRLVPYKKFDLAIKAFNKLGLPLKIAGGGPEMKKLKKIAKKNIEFLGSLKSSGNLLPKIYQGCRALIYPQEEDFGLVPLEAMACGKPVIAYKKGGALETVQEGQTGIFFNSQTVKDLISAVKRFEKMNFDPEKIVHYSKGFSKTRFKKEIEKFIEEKLTQNENCRS